MNLDKIENDPTLNRYLTSLKHQLWWLPKDKKDEILKEVKYHIVDSTINRIKNENKGINAAIESAINDFGDPRYIAKSYRNIYSPGRCALALFIALGMMLSPLTVSLPAIGVVSIAIYPMLLVYIFYLAFSFGKTTAIYTAISAICGRIVTLSISYMAFRGEYILRTTDVLIFIVVSVILLVPGFITSYREEGAEDY